ncbi:MAG: hypothetical protein KME35_17430 [Aphanocapsa sp. GSE-SYN-MK-11-07L]|jgi:hypothetical protein|nr:hypothetical protein [Aphanocapsa sp. GSE-SYN-MK-11-07L]
MNTNPNVPDISAILYLILGIANLSVGDYLPGIAWTSLSVSQYVVERVGSWPTNMLRFDRPVVILAWITYLIFAILILYYLGNLLYRAFR